MTTFTRIIIACLCIIAPTVNAHYDAVVWSTNPSTANTLQRFSIDDALAAATLDHPLLLIGVDNFDLTAFNKYANVYANEPSKRPITTSMRASHGYDAITLATDTALPADTVVVSAFTPPSIDIGAVSKARVLLVHATDMDELDSSITSVLEKLATNGYTAILTSSDALRSSEATQVRRKRAATVAPSTPAPVKEVKKLTDKCGVHVKGARIVVQVKSETFVLCSNTTSANKLLECENVDPNVRTFTVTLEPSKPCGEVPKDKTGQEKAPSLTTASMIFTVSRQAGIAHRDNWQVTSIVISDFKGTSFGTITTGVKLIDARTIELDNSIERGVGCGLTLPVYKFQNKTDTTKVSFQFVDVLISPFNYDSSTFSVNTTMLDDCVPMFTAGSWMGIMVGFLILSVFLFGLLMLSELSVMDRFDDPKGKPLQINVKNE